MIAYIDDLIVLGKDVEDHFRNLEIVLKRLHDANLKLKLSKCYFFKKEVTYLGHKLSEKGVEVTEEKIKAINNFPRPTTQKAVKSFIGLAGFFRMFVPNFADIAAPMTDLLCKDSEFRWGDRQETAFKHIKRLLTSSPVLILPDFEREFVLATDASDIGIGACLMQTLDYEMKLQAIAYYSRKLNKTQEIFGDRQGKPGSRRRT